MDIIKGKIINSDIVIVDDNVANLQVLSDMLRRCGVKIRPFLSGELALIAIEKQQPDLILLDISMPEMDGYEVCERLKNNLKTKNIPIIFLSAHTETIDKVKAFEIGGADYITKPFQIEELKVRIVNQLKIRFLQMEYERHNNDLKEIIEEQIEEISDSRHYEKVRTEFFTNISHELKTPLHLTFSAVQIIELTLNNNMEMQCENIKKYTKIMKQNCYRLIRIINNIIDISKIDAGYFCINPQNVDIVNVVENITMSVVDYVESKNISIIFDTEMEEKVLACDPDSLERVILNLLSNAIKFTPTGESIEVNIYDKEDFVAISVKDTGIGIPFEKQTSIFDRFVQVDKSLSRNREGSGIGLSLVRSLVELNNGTISLISKPNKGSEFIIELPVKLVDFKESLNKQNIYSNENKVEKISIEFSDIYN